MIQEQILQNLNTLPQEAQKDVLDFIALLKIRYEHKPKNKATWDLDTVPFVGIWEDRADMQNSSAWVRSVRIQEWK